MPSLVLLKNDSAINDFVKILKFRRERWLIVEWEEKNLNIEGGTREEIQNSESSRWTVKMNGCETLPTRPAAGRGSHVQSMRS